MKLILSLILTQLLVYPLQAQTYDDIKTLSTAIGNKYGITLYFDTFPQKTTWDIDYELAQEKDYKNLHNYLKLFDQEFSKYPLSFIKKTKLSGVAFAHSLTVGMSFQEVTGIPDYLNEIIIMDFLRGNYDNLYQRHSIHHEYYHMIEEQFNHDPVWKDPTWNQFNTSLKSYGYGGRYAQKRPNTGKLKHPDKGFVNLYAKTALEEDKAVIFSILFVPEEYSIINKWLKTDEVLVKKINYLKDFLKSKDKNFTDQYWNNLHSNTHDHIK